MIINSRNYAVAFLYTCRKKPALLSTSRPEQMGETRGVISLCSTTEMGELKIDPQAATAASLELSYPDCRMLGVGIYKKGLPETRNKM